MSITTRTIALLLPLALCLAGAAGAGAEEGLLARIEVTPASHQMSVGQSVTFKARAYDSQDKPVPFIPTWSATGGGSIDSSGRYTATTLGAYTISAWDPATGIAGTAAVVVTPPPKEDASPKTESSKPAPSPLSRVVRLDVLPGTASIRSGRSVRFTVVAYLADGSVYTPGGIHWRASGGRIDSSGAFTAGVVPGLFSVTAWCPGGRGVARVRVIGTGQTRVHSITVSPRVARLQIGQLVRFKAMAQDAAGQILPITPLWSATGGGTISHTGLFRATYAGRYLVIARDPASHVYGSATIEVGLAAPQVARMVIFPKQAVVRAGQTVPFKATGYDRFGRPVACTPLWSASGGHIDQFGRYTAGRHLGLFKVVVKDRISGAVDVAQVTVVRRHLPPHPGRGRIVVKSWDVGGGNFFRPKAKIEVTTYGHDAHLVQLIAVSSAGVGTELQSRACSNGSSVKFDARYDRMGTARLELRLFDTRGRVIARLSRAPR